MIPITEVSMKYQKISVWEVDETFAPALRVLAQKFDCLQDVYDSLPAGSRDSLMKKVSERPVKVEIEFEEGPKPQVNINKVLEQIQLPKDVHAN